jgi:sugar phosphate isomerase/epimerase
MRRREFIAASMLPLLARAAGAREPITRNAAASFRPSLAAYSLREYFPFMRGKPQTPRSDGKPIDFFGFIDYCASIECDAAEITSYFLPPHVTDSYLRELRQHAFLQGITISGTAIGNDFTVDDPKKLQQQIDETIDWIKKASVLGAPHIRIFAGTAKQLGESEEKMNAICRAVNECAKVAEDYGVFLGIENHGGIGADQLLHMMSRVDSSWVGINLDTGNFVSNDPYREMEVCAPFAVNVQFKATLKTPEGKAYPADFDRIASILRASKYRGFVALEYEEEHPYERIPELFKQMATALEMPK